MAKKFPIHPANPERICWGCDKYCPANALMCGNCWGCDQFCSIDAMACSNERSPHPAELFGDDWLAWGDQQLAQVDTPKVTTDSSEKNT